MIDQESTGPAQPVPLVVGGGLVLASVVVAGAAAIGFTTTVGGYDVRSVAAGVVALALVVWGLFAATRGTYRRGVGALSGGAGLVLIFLAPQARSELLFVVTGALVVALSGLFLIAEGFGYVLVAVDDTDDAPADEESTAEP